jgi:hypothetical protein
MKVRAIAIHRRNWLDVHRTMSASVNPVISMPCGC